MQLQYTPFVRQLKQMYVEQVGEIVKPWALQVRQRDGEGAEGGEGVKVFVWAAVHFSNNRD